MPTVHLILPGFGINGSQGSPGLSTVMLIRGKSNVLVDTGHMGRRRVLLEALHRAGVEPAEISKIVLTHAHWDHAQNMDLFPNATILISPEELEYTKSPPKGDTATPPYFLDMIRSFKVEHLRDGQEVEPGVTVVDTPGHTRGHISLLVETPSGTVCLSADALPNTYSVLRGKPDLIAWSEKAAQRSVERLLAAARMFYPGHDRPFHVLPTGVPEYTDEGVASVEFWGWLDMRDHPGVSRLHQQRASQTPHHPSRGAGLAHS